MKKIDDILNTKIKSYKKLGGLSNENYLIFTDNGDFVCRFNKDKLVNRENELHNMSLVKDFDAPVVYFDENIKITKHISHKKLTPPLDSYKVEILAKRLSFLHGVDGEFFGEFNMVKECKRYEDILGSLDGEYFELKEKFLRFFKGLTPAMPLVPCHNDLVLENILYADKKVYFIDWEFSSQNLPTWDMAVLFLEGKFSKENEGLFLEKYLKYKNFSLNMQKLNHEIDMQKIAYKIISYLWAKSKSMKDDRFKHYAKECLKYVAKSL